MPQDTLFSSDDLPLCWHPDRRAGLARLTAWLPRAGRVYAGTRNHDFGPGRHDMVSGLSPWLRHRLIEEREVLAAVLSRHSLPAAEKYIQEVFWRAYFKGYMEQHPSIWHRYRSDLDRLAAQHAGDPALARALEGRTGIEPFDAWTHELRDTGYLHNHARMWFASIWIFTLRLPWQLGADFFLRHLLDGDPASNTLSWRWVGGLHTRGKTYLARPDNIAAYTDGRFAPVKGLASRAMPLEESISHPRIPAPKGDEVPAQGRLGLLVTTEDCRPETLSLRMPPVALLGLETSAKVAPRVRAFSAAALTDALDRGARHFDLPAHRDSGDWGQALAAWAEGNRLSGIVTAYAPLGPAAEALEQARPTLAAAGIPLYRVLRRHDETAWPHATQGFFKLKKQIPALLAGLADGPGT